MLIPKILSCWLNLFTAIDEFYGIQIDVCVANGSVDAITDFQIQIH